MKNQPEKITYSISVIRCWTHGAIMCYLRNHQCVGCIYSEILESTKCKLNIAVPLLIQRFGLPTERQIENYYKIEEELENDRNGFKDSL